MDSPYQNRAPSTEGDAEPNRVLTTTEVDVGGADGQEPTFILQPATLTDPTVGDHEHAPEVLANVTETDTQERHGSHVSQDESGPDHNEAGSVAIDADDSAETRSAQPDADYAYADNVGTETVPARPAAAPAHASEEDLPDQVRSDVRPRTDHALESLEGEAYATEQALAEEAQQDVRDAGVVAAALQQPSQGVQAGATEAEPEGEEETTASDARAAATGTRRASAHREEAAHRADAPTSATPVPITTNMHAAHSTTKVIMTLEPMGCQTSLVLPVQRFHGEADGYRSAAPTRGSHTNNHWVVIAKDLFEAIAAHLAVHPQAFHLFRNGERVRFMSTLFLERDTASTDTSTGVEPLWLSVVFPPDEAEPLAEEGEANISSSSVPSSVPAHLRSLLANDVLVKCIYVRKSKPVILPSTLVENRQRHGLTFDQIIQVMNEDAGAQADPTLMAAVSVVHSGEGTAKPFMGGYRDTRDHSRVLHHASTQLFMKDLNYSPFPEKHSTITERQSRQTQTWGTSRSCQTHRECCVQTPVTGVVLDTSCDVVVTARPYFSAAALLALRTQKAIVLQKLYRQWKARAIRRELEAAETEKQHRAEARQRAEEAAQLARDELERLRRSDPRSANDFERIKAELNEWRTQEAAYVHADPSLSEEEKRAALLAITKQELKLLQELERHRRQAMMEGKDRQFDRTMEKMASAKLWGQVEVTTRESERARELMELYRALTHSASHAASDSSSSASPASAPGLTSSSSRAATRGADETNGASAAPLSRTASRLDVLLHVKWTVKEFDSELTRELCQLIDREADLLHRGRKEASLAGLRQRIALLFKQFIEDPEHNPGMAEYTRSAVGRLKARTLYGTVYAEDGSAVPGTTLVQTAAAKAGSKKAGAATR